MAASVSPEVQPRELPASGDRLSEPGMSPGSRDSSCTSWVLAPSPRLGLCENRARGPDVCKDQAAAEKGEAAGARVGGTEGNFSSWLGGAVSVWETGGHSRVSARNSALGAGGRQGRPPGGLGL